MDGLDDLPTRYRVILCDIWGVVHDGGQILPGVEQRLLRWKSEERRIVLITNAPRPAETVRRHLDQLGLSESAYDVITSSGEAGIAALTGAARPVGFLGSLDDRADLEAHGVTIAESGYDELACTGLDVWSGDPTDYVDQLRASASRDVLMHCLNPDRVVIHCGRREACAGALADLYEAMGGRVAWYGKPYPAIYNHALSLVGSPARQQVLAIGDGLPTDMLGAARFGIDAVFVTHGIHAGQPVPPDFAGRNGLGDWRPLMTVAGLA